MPAVVVDSALTVIQSLANTCVEILNCFTKQKIQVIENNSQNKANTKL